LPVTTEFKGLCRFLIIIKIIIIIIIITLVDVTTMTKNISKQDGPTRLPERVN
jgi:hypothetical protein